LDHVYGSTSFIEASKQLSDIAVVSPDVGGAVKSGICGKVRQRPTIAIIFDVRWLNAVQRTM